MKKIIALLTVAILFAVTGCNQTQLLTNNFNNWLKKHNYEQTAVYNKFTKSTHFVASIDVGYSAKTIENLENICTEADITYKVVKGKLIISADCAGAEQKVREIFGKLFNQIVSNKQ